MRALGLMEPMTMLALDEWEIARDRVVINRLGLNPIFVNRYLYKKKSVYSEFPFQATVRKLSLSLESLYFRSG